MKKLKYLVAVPMVAFIFILFTTTHFTQAQEDGEISENDDRYTILTTIVNQLEELLAAIQTRLTAAAQNSNSKSETAQSNVADKLNEIQQRTDKDIAGVNIAIDKFLEDEIVVKYAADKRPKILKTNGRDVHELIAELTEMEDVEYAEPNYIVSALNIPNDPLLFSDQWNFHTSSTTLSNIANNPSLYAVNEPSVNAIEAWEKSTGEGVVVAVVDTGVSYGTNPNTDYLYYFIHNILLNQRAVTGTYYEWDYPNTGFMVGPDLAGTRFVTGYNTLTGTSNANDDNGHGTHVAGTIAQSTNNGLGTAGLAYNAKIMPVKVLDKFGSGYTWPVAEGIYFAADNGADVINLSLGFGSPSQAIKDAVCYAHNKGVVVVAASGNNGAYQTGSPKSTLYPAAYDGCVIAVGATDQYGNRATFSNAGTQLDLMAPGVDITQETIGRPSVTTNYTVDPTDPSKYTFAWDEYIWWTDFQSRTFKGTSMAAPHVAAAAALLIANGNATTPAEVEFVLSQTARDIDKAGWDARTGYGIIDIAAALNEEPWPNGKPEAPLDNIFHQNSFENKFGGWQQTGARTWDFTDNHSTDGRWSARVSGDSNNSQLTSPTFVGIHSLPVTRVSFDWRVRENLENSEGMLFKISSDDGETWSTYATLYGNVNDEQWHTETFEFKGLTNLTFKFVSNINGGAERGFIDNFKVVGQKD